MFRTAPAHPRAVAAAGGAVVVLGLAGVASMVGAMTPVVHVAPVVTPTPTPLPLLVAADAPARVAVTAAAKALPVTLSGLGAAATSPDMPVQGCVAPIASATRAWAGGSWLAPKGVVITISAYPPGMGRTAADCSTADQTIQHGDVVATIELTRTGGVDRAVVDKALLANLASCKDTSATPDQSGRNPYSGHFIGYVKPFRVDYDGPAPRTVTTLSATAIEPPSTPGHPHAPESLPQAPAKPSDVAAPTKPTLSATVNARVPDPVGPGCGWVFAAQQNPNTPAEDARLTATATAAVAAQQKALHTAADTYTAQLRTYDTQAATFTAQNRAWETYRATVSDIAAKWAAQTEQWNDYQNRLSAYQSSVEARDSFIAEQDSQRRSYESAMATCQKAPVMVTPPPVVSTNTPAPVPSTIPTTVVSPDPSGTPVTVPTVAEVWVQPPPIVQTSRPEPTPVWTAQPCPDRPSILDQQPPAVGDKPVEPTFR